MVVFTTAPRLRETPSNEKFFQEDSIHAYSGYPRVH